MRALPERARTSRPSRPADVCAGRAAPGRLAGRRSVRAYAPPAAPTNAATLGVSVAAAAVLSSVSTALVCLVAICCCAPYFFPREHTDEETPRTGAASSARAQQYTHPSRQSQPLLQHTHPSQQQQSSQPSQYTHPSQQPPPSQYTHSSQLQQQQQPSPYTHPSQQPPPPPTSAPSPLVHRPALVAPLARRPAPPRGPPSSFSHPQYTANTGAGSPTEQIAAQLRTLAAASTPQPARPRMLPAPEADRKMR